MAETGETGNDFKDMLTNEFFKFSKKHINDGIRYFGIINFIFDCLIVVLILLFHFKIIDVGLLITIFVISLLGIYVTFGGSVFLYTIGHILSEKNTRITEHSYYSPGSRESISKMDINEIGICLHWKKKDIYIKDSTPYYEYTRIPYDKIKKIHSQTIRFFSTVSGHFYKVETKDNRIGYISSGYHPETVFKELLKKYLGQTWESVYSHDENSG